MLFTALYVANIKLVDGIDLYLPKIHYNSLKHRMEHFVIIYFQNVGDHSLAVFDELANRLYERFQNK